MAFRQHDKHVSYTHSSFHYTDVIGLILLVLKPIWHLDHIMCLLCALNVLIQVAVLKDYFHLSI